jgi:hypothetical protein
MSSWEDSLTFPHGPFPLLRTDSGGETFTAARDDFAFSTVVTLPPPAPVPEPVPEPVVEQEPLPSLPSTPETPTEEPRKRGLFGRKKRSAERAEPVQRDVGQSDPEQPVPGQPVPEQPDPEQSAPGQPVPAPDEAVEPQVQPGPLEPLPELAEPVLSVVDEAAIETDFITFEAEVNGGAERVAKTPKSHRFGRRKSASEQPEDSPETQAAVAGPSEEESSLIAEAPAGTASAREAPEVLALVTGGSREQEESPVIAWLGRARELATSPPGAPSRWSPGEGAPGAGSLPPIIGTSWSGSDTQNDESSAAEEDQDSGDNEEPRSRRRLGWKKGGGKSKNKASARTATAEPYIPSFGFAAQPEHDLKWAAAAHWATIPLLWVGLGFLAPFFVLAARAEGSQFVQDHATASLNFQITVLLGMLVTAFLGLISTILFLIPLLLAALAAVAAWSATKAARGSREAKYIFALPVF